MAAGRIGWLRIKARKPPPAIVEKFGPPGPSFIWHGRWHYATGALAERVGGQSIQTACGYIATYVKSRQEWASSDDTQKIKAGEIPDEVCGRCVERETKLSNASRQTKPPKGKEPQKVKE